MRTEFSAHSYYLQIFLQTGETAFGRRETAGWGGAGQYHQFLAETGRVDAWQAGCHEWNGAGQRARSGQTQQQT
jgi:hypothetical protein